LLPAPTPSLSTDSAFVITTVDADGVALAANQGLNQKLEEKEAKISALEKRLAALEKLMNSSPQKQLDTGH
jgi:hypothetical protein